MAALETDMATTALASQDLGDLEALALLCLQRGLLDVEGAERVFEALGRVGAGLRAGRKWMRWLRYPKGEGDDFDVGVGNSVPGCACARGRG